MTEQEYHDAIRFVNDTIKPARATTTDQVLLATGASMVTLVPFAIRQKKRKALRKKLLNQAIDVSAEGPFAVVLRAGMAHVCGCLCGSRSCISCGVLLWGCVRVLQEFNRTHESLRMLWLKSIESLVIERAPKREGSA